MRRVRASMRGPLARRGEVGHAHHVDVDRIEEAAIGRMVRARALAVFGEERMQRIDADDRAAGARGRDAGLGERREIADALVAGAAQRVEMRGEPEATRACRKRLGRARRGLARAKRT